MAVQDRKPLAAAAVKNPCIVCSICCLTAAAQCDGLLVIELEVTC